MDKNTFRTDVQEAQKVLNKIIPDAELQKMIFNLLARCLSITNQINNNNWNINLDNSLLRFNCGNRYILNVEQSSILFMCWRETFLKLGREYINNFLQNISLYDDPKALKRPSNYEELVDFPLDYLWHKTFRFNILFEQCKEYIEILTPSIIDFAKDSIKNSSLLSQSMTAHSSALVQIINEQSGKKIKQPDYYKTDMDSNGYQDNNNPQDMINKYISLLKDNYNLIFTGAPGTGKTYLAKQIAKAMDAETAFVQFHPSYDYTDFVEGLRPSQPDENGNIGFERKDGVFKEFCKRALKNWIDSKKSEQELQQAQSLQDKISSYLSEAIENNTELKTKTGSKFFIKDVSENQIIISIPENKVVAEIKVNQNGLFDLLDKNINLENVKDIKNHFSRQFNTQQDSYTFTLCHEIRKIKNTQLLQNVQVITLKPFVFIIDEINRGEISKIFGELFFSIDPGYRGEKGLVQTQYQNLIEEGDAFKKGFYVPENVYIIGTMNDIDRSVESMDFAMRRRFAWQEITAAESAENMGLSNEIKSRMKRLNDAISKIEGLNSSYHIGGSYFLKEQDADKLWDNHLRGLLFEYLRGMPDADGKLNELRTAYDGTITND